MSDVAFPALAIATFGFFFAGLVKGAVGLGFSSTCLPFLVLALGLDRAMPLVLIPSMASNTMVHVQAGRVRDTLSLFWPMIIALVPGLMLGLWLLARIDLDYAAAILGLVLVAYGGWTLSHIDAMLPAAWIRPLRIPVGFFTGLVNGFTGSQIMPLLPFLLSQTLERNVFLQTINTCFTLSSLIIAVGLWKIGFLNAEMAAYSVAALIPMVAGVSLGTWVRNRLSADVFRKAVLMLLIALGLLLVVRTIL